MIDNAIPATDDGGAIVLEDNSGPEFISIKQQSSPLQWLMNHPIVPKETSYLSLATPYFNLAIWLCLAWFLWRKFKR
jgi:hypothetical protein